MVNEGQEFFENKLDEFRQKKVTRDNYVQYVRDVNNIIKEANSSINEMREDVTRLQNRLQQLKEEEIGEDELERLRSKGPQNSKWNFEVYQISRLKSRIIQKYEVMFERAMVRGDLHDVKGQQIQPILDTLDAEQIRSDVYEQMNDLTEKRIDNAEERLEGRLDSVDSKHESNYREMRRQVRDVREAARREAQENGTELVDFMDKLIDRLDANGVSTQDLEKHKENINTGQKVDDVDLMSDDSDVEESETDSGDSGSVSGVDKEEVKEELRKLEGDDEESEFGSQSEIADEYGISSARVSQLKKEALEE